MRTLGMVALVVSLVACVHVASADVFNMGGSRNPTTGQWTGDASLQFVAVGDINNAADTTGYGSVGYAYQMGKYDVTAAQYCQFLNAVAATDTYGLYNTHMAPANNLPAAMGGAPTFGIVQSGSPGSYTYSVTGNRNFPMNMVTWGDAARFANWLTNGQPGGAQGASTTEDGSYTLNGVTTATALNAVTRNADARYAIPTENEWYKAAYYGPTLNGGAGGYWLYPTQNNSTPSNVLAPTGTNNANFAVYNGGYIFTDPTNYLTAVGAFASSPSAYGTFDQGGDVWQWNEAVLYGSGRGFRGGSLGQMGSDVLKSSYRYIYDPTYEHATVGFRVALIPEPATLSLLALGGLLIARRRACSLRAVPGCVSLLVVAMAMVPSAEAADYAAVDLTPAGLPVAECANVSGGQQVGGGQGPATGGRFQAMLWTGSAGSYVNLNPAGCTWSCAYDVSGGQQAGWGRGPATGDNMHAMLWTGSAGSCVDLNPAGFTWSCANGISGGQQAGYGYGPTTGGNYHALLWTGSAASCVDLNPPGFTVSAVFGMSDGQPAGWGRGPATGNGTHALLWTGSAGSYVDLHPAGFMESQAADASGGQQVGWGTWWGSTGNHALLWTGSAGSCVDLNPAGFTNSRAYGVSGGRQAGYAWDAAAGTDPFGNPFYHALLWSGTADSYVDLHQTLGPGFSSSLAMGTDSNGDVVGWAVDLNGNHHSILWTPTPEPTSMALLALGGLLIARRRACGSRAMPCCVSLLVVAVAMVPSAEAADYVAADLTPAGFTTSYAFCASGGQQVGNGSGPTTGGNYHALLWTGSADSYVDLNPAGFTASYANAVSGGQQAGGARGPTTGGYYHAMQWTGSAGSYVDLHPAGFTNSGARGVSGDQQVGYGWGPTTGTLGDGSPLNHALLWSGSAGSCVDLHPAGFSYSVALGVSDGQQAGYGWGPGTMLYGRAMSHALLWTGSAGSCVDLNPAGFMSSEALGVSGGQQAGYGCLIGGNYSHALLWTGSAGSCVDLNPAGFAGSLAYAVSGGRQVGSGQGIDRNPHAMLWTGSADSYVDLHLALGPGFSLSEAYGIDSSGSIVGMARDLNGVDHAILWVSTPEPATLALLALGGLLIARRRQA